jgi:hypothetical protein
MPKFEIQLTLTREQLATNPCDPNVLDTHIIDRQRKMILEKSGVNATINKYLDQIPIAKEKGAEELQKLIDKLEEMTGYTFTSEEREMAITGKLIDLKETFKQLDVKGTTVFFWDKESNKPCIGDHMIYGFLKSATESICRTVRSPKRGTVLQSISYTQSLINQHVRCETNFISFDQDVKRKENGDSFFLQRSLRAMTAQGPRISLAKSEVVPAGAKLRFKLNVMEGSPIEKEVLCKLFDCGQFFGLGQWRNAGYGLFVYELMEVK